MAIKTKDNVVHILFVQMRINCKQWLIEIKANIIRGGKLANYTFIQLHPSEFFSCKMQTFLSILNAKIVNSYQPVVLLFRVFK
jgi:hypothetical protein